MKTKNCINVAWIVLLMCIVKSILAADWTEVYRAGDGSTSNGQIEAVDFQSIRQNGKYLEYRARNTAWGRDTEHTMYANCSLSTRGESSSKMYSTYPGTLAGTEVRAVCDYAELKLPLASLTGKQQTVTSGATSASAQAPQASTQADQALVDSLYAAIKNRDVREAERIMKGDSRVNYSDAACDAAMVRSLDMVMLFVSETPPRYVPVVVGGALRCGAQVEGNGDVIRFLVSKGGDVNQTSKEKDRPNWTSLDIANAAGAKGNASLIGSIGGKANVVTTLANRRDGQNGGTADRRIADAGLAGASNGSTPRSSDGSAGNSERCFALAQAALKKDMGSMSETELRKQTDDMQRCIDQENAAKAATIAPVTSAGNCPANLSYLDAKLPRYPSDDVYSKMRAEALNENMVDDLAKARQQGYTPAGAAEATLQQVKIAEGVQRSMADVARAYNNSSDQTLQQVINGSYPTEGRALPLPLQGYLMAYVGVVVNREAAAALACIARA